MDYVREQLGGALACCFSLGFVNHLLQRAVRGIALEAQMRSRPCDLLQPIRHQFEKAFDPSHCFLYKRKGRKAKGRPNHS